MPNTIKYSTTGDTQSLKKGNFFFGVGDVGKGPSSATTYYNGSTPVASGYTIYSFDANQTSRISYASPTTDSEFISITNAKSGQNFTGATQCLNWYATQTDHVAVNKDYEPIVTNGLISAYDFGFTPSYPKSGSTLYNLSFSGTNSTIYNGPLYTTQYGGGIQLDNINEYLRLFSIDLNALAASNNFTIGFWCIKEYYGSGGNLYGNSTLINGVSNGYGTGWRIVESSQGTVGNPFNGRHSFSIGLPDVSNPIYVSDGSTIYRPVYIVLSVTPTTTFAYCNGGYSSKVTGTYITGSTYGYIGAEASGAGKWAGKIWNFQIYNRGLTLSEVKQNYLAYINRFVGKNIVTNGLILYLDANYTGSYPTSGSTWSDVSGNNFNSTLTNGPTYSTDGGGSIVFDGVDDYGTISDSSELNLSNSITLSSWIKISSGATGSPTIIKKEVYNSASSNSGYLLRVDTTTNYPFIYLWNNGGNIAGGSSGDINRESWYHMCGTYDGNQIKFYLNGVLKSTVNYSGGIGTNTSQLFVGQNTASYRMNGKIANTQIYNRGITQSEVFQNYQAQLPTILGENIVMDGMVLYLDAGYRTSYPTTGTTWNNVSGVSGGTGTLTNGPSYSGGTIIFDGVDDYVTLGSTFNFIYTDTFTTETWINWSGGAQPNNAGHLIGKTFGNYRTFLITNTNPGRIRFSLGLNVQQTETSSIIQPNTWYHVVCTWSPSTSTAKIFINGTESATTTNTNNTWTLTTGSFQIGTSPNESYYFNGKIAMSRVYNKTLSQNQITQNFNAQKSRFGL